MIATVARDIGSAWPRTDAAVDNELSTASRWRCERIQLACQRVVVRSHLSLRERVPVCPASRPKNIAVYTSVSRASIGKASSISAAHVVYASNHAATAVWNVEVRGIRRAVCGSDGGKQVWVFSPHQGLAEAHQPAIRGGRPSVIQNGSGHPGPQV